MNIHITKEAGIWYKEELELSTPTQIRLYPRYGGVGGIIPGFSIGINNDTPETIYASFTIEDIQFFVEEQDSWYFDGYDLKVQLNKELDEPEFIYES